MEVQSNQPPPPPSPDQRPLTSTGAIRGFFGRWEHTLTNVALVLPTNSFVTSAKESFARGDTKMGLVYGAGALVTILGGIANSMNADRSIQEREETIQTQQQIIDTLGEGGHPPKP